MNPETDFSIRSFLGGYDKNFTYLITCSRTGTQAIVDTAIDTNEIEASSQIELGFDTSKSIILPKGALATE